VFNLFRALLSSSPVVHVEEDFTYQYYIAHIECQGINPTVTWPAMTEGRMVELAKSAFIVCAKYTQLIN
jgi:hypothetical protein